MSYRVLVVDDAVLTRALLSEFLDELGHQVVAEAGTGREALDLCRKIKPDLVTLDISLPDMNGLEVLKELRKVDSSVRVIVISGNDQNRVLETSRQMGSSLLSKPFDFAAFEKAVSKVFEPGA
jgi:two-component system chemotaxis response regulator CheY